MRTWGRILAMLVIVTTMTGCATVQKKFTRKKKVPDRIAPVIYIEQGPYQKKYSNSYYYKTHFSLWKSWHDDLLTQLGGNGKKVSRAGQEVYSNAVEMNRYLNPEKQAEFKIHVDALKKVLDEMERATSRSVEKASFRVELERIRREIANGFSYESVKGDLLPDAVDLGDQDAAASTDSAGAPAQ